MTHRTRQRITWAALGLVWAGALGLGLVVLAAYENTPGAVGTGAPRWPTEAPVALDAAGATLLVFAHPHCPCTRATMDELERLASRLHGRMTAHVLFYHPADEPASWAHSDLWATAARLPGVTPHADVDGRVAHRFGALTSGHAVLYAPDGRRLFHGGITGSRGHAGDNLGQQAVIAWVEGRSDAPSEGPAFGCALHTPSTSTSVPS